MQIHIDLSQSQSKLKPESNSETAETSVSQKCVQCANEECNERIVINSDDEIVTCKNCGSMALLSCLELLSMPNSDDLNQQSDELKPLYNKVQLKCVKLGTIE